ncbi:MAG: glycosyltransferase family 4 protein [Acholeplasmataceae bacterium]|nr:glycosyltransferase family 4 protein [Acholeplasmataceae bacterium]
MARKILFVAHMDSHIANFHLPYLKWFKKQGYLVHVASNSQEKTRPINYCDQKYEVQFARSPFSPRNIKAFRQLKKIVSNNEYALIHCHTPIGGVITRIVARKTKIPVFYTAHGFHFHKHSSLIDWLLFYPIERWLSRYTTELITINEEDFQLAKSKFKRSCSVNYIPGVGVDQNEHYPLTTIENQKNKAKLGLAIDDFVMVCVGELTKNKNQVFLVRAMATVIKTKPKAKLLLLGYGVCTEKLRKLIKKLNLENHVLLLGFRNDVLEIMNFADLVVSSSRREGLPKCLLEALAIGKPMLGSDCRGNVDIIVDGENGYLYQIDNQKDFLQKLAQLMNNPEALKRMGEKSMAMCGRFELDIVLEQMATLYKKHLEEGKR